MDSFQVTDRLAREIGKTPEGRVWLRELPDLVDEAARHFGLESIKVIQPGGHTAFVAEGLRDGELVVLKIPGLDNSGEKALLRAGSRLLPRLIDEHEGACLLEHIQGKAFQQLDDVSIRMSAAEIIDGLDQLPEIDAPRIETQVDPLLDGYPEQLQIIVALTDNPAGNEEVMLHGDLHEENLFMTDDGVKALDPKPMRGHREYDLEPLFRRYADRGDSAAASQLLAMLKLQGIDPQRLRACCLRFGVHYHQLSTTQERRRLWERRIAFWLNGVD